jgi:ParB family chromosome partitioning protein
MTNTTAMEVELKNAPQPSAMQDIPLSVIQESPTNPRRRFDETQLAELAENIRLHGVLQPVLVRPLPGVATGSYELVAGARRYRASKLARRESIPATVRELNDTECLELQLIENLERADVHELDEARGYAALMRLQPDVYSVEVLAEKIGRSEKCVYARLRLTHLVEDVQRAFYAGKLTVAHAFEIARLQPHDQQRALVECFPQHRTTVAVLKDKKAEAVTVRSLREWIEREILLDISNAPFDAKDEALVPAAGSCAVCPKRTGNNPLLFPDVRQKSICTDRKCYRAKVESLVQIRLKPGQKPVLVSPVPAWQVKKPQKNVLYEGQYRRTAKKGECPETRPAVVSDGPDAGKVLFVCRDEKCKIHAQASRYQPTPQERAVRAKELLAERVEKQTRICILSAVRKKIPAVLPTAELRMIALDYLRRLGHDNHRRLCRVYGWQEKKTKTSRGAFCVDYLAAATKAVDGMNRTEILHFLVVCALISDLACPGYDPRQPLAKDSNLTLTAARYKVDTASLASAVREELSRKRPKGGASKAKGQAAA